MKCWMNVKRRRLVKKLLVGAVAMGVMAVSSGCFRLHMYDQARHEPLEQSAVFANGQSARDFVPGTVARGMLREDRHFFTGMEGDSQFTDAFPIEVTREVLARGQERFNIFCSPCHGRTGAGNGMVVRRGYKKPETYHSDRLRNERVGYFYDVITNGFSKMPAYRSQIPPQDRWAIVAYIRALQLSQHAVLSELPASVRSQIRQAATRQPGDQHGEHH